MTFGWPAEPYEVDPTITKALDMLLILHADHEQNCSTSTVRMVGSAHANLFASVSRESMRCSGHCMAALIRRFWRCSNKFTIRTKASTSSSSE